MEENRLRNGWTTGTCAQAASKASVIMLITGKKIETVDVETPSGENLRLNVLEQEIGARSATCCVKKDAGDDIDATDGIKIYSRVGFSEKPGIEIKGGVGIGIATKPGLPVKIGDYAINPVPRRMIAKEIEVFRENNNGFEVIISAPEGEKIAEKTFNPRLGIKGGISILGTTGIVKPKSLEAYKKTLSMCLNVLKSSGYDRAFLVFGYVGENYCRNVLKISRDMVIQIGDHAGFMLSECVKTKISNVILVGYLGKAVKIAAGQFDTNIKYGDNRIETIYGYAEKYGVKEEILQQIKGQTTAQAVIEILERNRYEDIFDIITRDIVKKMKEWTGNSLSLGCILLSIDGKRISEYHEK
ncbi:MAG: cobalt-precorrin-5B (C(1))-methyltransferase CbiD [Candidatus Omnitrophica bacterium]|nr:cobalt-precorrin-5B (C(1))-methyltransferase CbiD [Candidatus Omnitrophota bacterium]